MLNNFQIIHSLVALDTLPGSHCLGQRKNKTFPLFSCFIQKINLTVPLLQQLAKAL